MAKAVPIHKLTLPDAELRASAAVLLVRLEEMLEYAQASRDPANVVELHEMRIASKRLRYTMEVFAPVLGPDAPALLATITELQERLGQIHDCDVLLPLLATTLDKETKREHKTTFKSGAGLPPFLAAEGLAALMSRKRAERARLYDEFVTFWDALPPDGFAQSLSDLVSKPNPGVAAGFSNTDLPGGVLLSDGDTDPTSLPLS